MFTSDCLGINEKGHLTIGGVDTVVLAEKYGTPLYVMDETTIRSNMRQFRDSINEFYSSNGMCLYASKAMCCKELCRIASEEGVGLDVVSGGELFTAHEAGFDMQKVFFHGNNKTDQELRMAVKYGVGRIVVDSFTELDRIDALGREFGKKIAILIRITPGVDAHTHDFIRTGIIDCKFGFTFENDIALSAVKSALSKDYIELKGIHCHIGSQIFELEPFAHTAQVMVNFIIKVKNELGFRLSELDLGGGFGIKYLDSDDPRPYSEFMKPVSLTVNRLCADAGVEVPSVFIEPGRSIVGPAGITLYTVGTVKEIPGVRTYLSVDGGMTDNPRYILYSADYTAVVANRADEPADTVVTIAGKCCESGDLIQENTPVQAAQPGDILAVLSTGAYNYSMSSNYNRIPRPAVIMVNDGKDRLIVRSETYEDMATYDI